MSSNISSQDLFFEIWFDLLDQLKNNSRPEHLEKLIGFSCFEHDFLEVSLNKIDSLIKEGIDINLPFYIHPPRGYISENVLKKTIEIYEFGYRNKYVYNHRDSKEYLEELIYYLIERCQVDKNIIIWIVGHKKLYKILEDLLKYFDDKFYLSNYNINTEYLEILLGFSCLELDKKIIYSYRKQPALPIESLLIEYALKYYLNGEDNCLDVYSLYKQKKIQIINNIFLLKKYSPEPSFEYILNTLKKDFKNFPDSLKINDDFINDLVTDIFHYFYYKV